MHRFFRLLGRLSFAGLIAACTEPADITPATAAIVPAGQKTIASGTTMTFSAVVANAQGQILSEHLTQWASSDPAVATISPLGVATGLRIGSTQISATAGSARSVDVMLTVIPGAAARLAIRTQPAAGRSGLPLGTQPVVEVQDAVGNLVSSSTSIVTATIAQGGGTITGSTAQSVNGVATFSGLTLAGTFGDRTLTFSVAGLAPVTSGGVAVEHGLATQLVIRSQPSGANSGATFTTPAVIELRDDAGNVATSSNTPITVVVASGTGALTNATAMPVNGIATFNDLVLDGLIGPRSLAFSATGFAPVVSNAFTLGAGQAASLRVQRQPGGASTLGSLAIQPVIEIIDSGGNIATSSNATINTEIVGCSASIGNGGAVSAVGGVATFTTLRISGPSGICSLRFTSPGLPAVTSAVFSLAPGPPASIRIIVQPVNTGPLTPLTTQPVIGLYDAAGNLATGYSGMVGATVASGQATLTGGFVPVVNGIGTYQALRVLGPPGQITIAFQSAGFTIISSPVAVFGGSPVRLAIRVYPPYSSRNGQLVSPQPVIEVQDGAGNISPVSVPVTITTDAVSGTIENGTVISVNGVATFTALKLSGPLGYRLYTFNSPGLAPTLGVYITIDP